MSTDALVSPTAGKIEWSVFPGYDTVDNGGRKPSFGFPGTSCHGVGPLTNTQSMDFDFSLDDLFGSVTTSLLVEPMSLHDTSSSDTEPDAINMMDDLHVSKRRCVGPDSIDNLITATLSSPDPATPEEILASMESDQTVPTYSSSPLTPSTVATHEPVAKCKAEAVANEEAQCPLMHSNALRSIFFFVGEAMREVAVEVDKLQGRVIAIRDGILRCCQGLNNNKRPLNCEVELERLWRESDCVDSCLAEVSTRLTKAWKAREINAPDLHGIDTVLSECSRHSLQIELYKREIAALQGKSKPPFSAFL